MNSHDERDVREARRQARADEAAAKARRKAVRPWWRRKRFVIPGAVVALVALAAVAPGGDPTNDAAQPVETATTRPASTTGEPQPDSGLELDPQPDSVLQVDPQPGIGDRARDGQFTFVVRRVDCGEQSVGGDFFNQDAQGLFCRVRVRVRNHGDREGTLFADNQYLIDDAEREFSASGDAMFADAPDALWVDINPGNRVTVDLLFDVPPDVTPRVIELHDSAFSGGVRVLLTDAPEPSPPSDGGDVAGVFYAQDDGDYAVKKSLSGGVEARVCRTFSDYLDAHDAERFDDVEQLARRLVREGTNTTIEAPSTFVGVAFLAHAGDVGIDDASELTMADTGALPDYMRARDRLSAFCFVDGSY